LLVLVVGSAMRQKSQTYDEIILSDSYEVAGIYTGRIMETNISLHRVTPNLLSPLTLLHIWKNSKGSRTYKLRGPFEKFVDSTYYSESELYGGAVTVSFSKYLPWQAMHFL
jgi:hypothetical protein